MYTLISCKYFLAYQGVCVRSANESYAPTPTFANIRQTFVAVSTPLLKVFFKKKNQHAFKSYAQFRKFIILY